MAKEDIVLAAVEGPAPKTKPAPKKIEAPITGARLIRMPREGKQHPAAIFRGEVPSKGSKLRLKLKNGAVHAGIVHDVTTVDGEVLVEFRDGLKPEEG